MSKVRLIRFYSTDHTSQAFSKFIYDEAIFERDESIESKNQRLSRATLRNFGGEWQSQSQKATVIYEFTKGLTSK